MSKRIYLANTEDGTVVPLTEEKPQNLPEKNFLIACGNKTCKIYKNLYELENDEEDMPKLEAKLVQLKEINKQNKLEIDLLNEQIRTCKSENNELEILKVSLEACKNELKRLDHEKSVRDENFKVYIDKLAEHKTFLKNTILKNGSKELNEELESFQPKLEEFILNSETLLSLQGKIINYAFKADQELLNETAEFLKEFPGDFSDEENPPSEETKPTLKNVIEKFYKFKNNFYDPLEYSLKDMLTEILKEKKTVTEETELVELLNLLKTHLEGNEREDFMRVEALVEIIDLTQIYVELEDKLKNYSTLDADDTRKKLLETNDIEGFITTIKGKMKERNDEVLKNILDTLNVIKGELEGELEKKREEIEESEAELKKMGF